MEQHTIRVSAAGDVVCVTVENVVEPDDVRGERWDNVQLAVIDE